MVAFSLPKPRLRLRRRILKRKLGWPSPLAWVFIALTITALVMRLWDLGGRSLHYDEILHAWYSWRFANGDGYSHTPLTHGPFLFHAAAATMAIFGSNDVTVRLLPALFGTALVAMPYLFRRQLGTYGALATAVFFTVSPSMLYFGRFVRNDIYMAVWAAALLAIMWNYIERPRTSLLVAWTAIWALAYTTKESSFLLAGIFGLFLIIHSTSDIWRWARGRMALSAVGPAGDLLIVLGTLSLPLWAPFVAIFQGFIGITLVNPDANDPGIATGTVVRAAVETGAPVGGGLYVAVFLVAALVLLSIVIGLAWDKRRWPWMAFVFIGITLSLFTSLFTNWTGFFTGYWGSLGYWIAQQTVERANQPMYYYVLGLSTYEFLVTIPALFGSAYLVFRGTLFDRTLVGWAALTFILFSIAGERMPWLLVGITLPLAMVAGRTVGLLTEKAKGHRFTPASFVGGAGLAVTIPFLLLEVIPSDNLTGSAVFWGAVLVFFVIIAVTTVYALRLQLDPNVATAQAQLGLLAPTQPTPIFAAAALGCIAVLLVLTIFITGRTSYSYSGFERPTELLVYSQTGQETSYAAECIGRVAEESGLGTERLRIVVGESDNFAWQWRWYLRDYSDVRYSFIKDEPDDQTIAADVVLISQSVEAKLRTQLDTSYTNAGKIKHLWWFPNTAYNHLTPGDVVSGATTRSTLEALTHYFLSREFNGSMYSSDGVIYVANEIAKYANSCTALRATLTPEVD